jgi:hypothetical protein
MPRILPAALLCALALGAAPAAPAADPDLRTTAERSGFRETGRYDEVIRLCAAYQQRWPASVRCEEFGRTPQGRPMQVLVASTSGALDPQAAQARGLPVLLVQGGIHAGEIDGKDAGFQLLREILEGRKGKGLLDRQVLLFVPVFNIDGHERFKAWNRPNQRGPAEMGWRVTAQNYNLNRDYVKADAPEMQAMLGLVQRWDPLGAIDLHVTDGAKFQHDVAIQVEPVHAGDAELRTAGLAFRDAVIAEMRKRGSDPLPFYPSFIVDDDPASGIADGVSPPRFSTGYFQLRNRFAMLVETHSWKDYRTRVAITHDTVLAVLRQVAAHGADWRRTELYADERARALGGTPVPLDYKATDAVQNFDFRGYAYSRSVSDVSGAPMTRYDESRPQVWHMPVHFDVQPSVSAVAPRAGYLVPAELAALVAPKLQAHGIEFRTLAAPLSASFEAYRTAKGNEDATSTEGHQRLKLSGEWKPEPRELVAGALYVPIAQPKARLVMALLEPQAPDSLLAWGEFNNFYERKEYMEAYVAEDVAREMLAKDPGLKAAFEEKLRTDAEFAKSPAARLEFFYRRHSAWDDRLGLYPVLRTEAEPPR